MTALSGLNPDFRDFLLACVQEDVEFVIVGAYALALHVVPFIGRDRFLQNKEAAGRPKDHADAARLKS